LPQLFWDAKRLGEIVWNANSGVIRITGGGLLAFPTSFPHPFGFHWRSCISSHDGRKRGSKLVMQTELWSSLRIHGFAASVLVPVLDPASPNAEAIYTVFAIVSLICLAIFVVVVWLITTSLIRSRAAGQRTPKQDFGNHRSEFVWAMGPVLIVLSLGVVSAKMILSIAPAPATEIAPAGTPDIVVVGHQWWWEVRYPASRAVTANEIHIPIGRKLLVQLDSADVIHSFWLPQLAPKIDMVPGQHNFLWLQSDRAGTYDGACSEFCGDQHAWMRFIVVADPEPQYQAWLALQAQPAHQPLDPAAKSGEHFFFTQTCINCHAIGGTSAIADAAPDLTHVAGRMLLAAGVIPNTQTNLTLWLQNPQKIKPGCKMPNFNLTDEQLNQLVAYLEGLK
jgi:cytochrome c oxidase subunit 2